jgi:hypothetical protein
MAEKYRMFEVTIRQQHVISNIGSTEKIGI